MLVEFLMLFFPPAQSVKSGGKKLMMIALTQPLGQRWRFNGPPNPKQLLKASNIVHRYVSQKPFSRDYVSGRTHVFSKRLQSTPYSESICTC